MDNMGVGIGGQGLGGTMGIGVWLGGGVDMRDRWGWAAVKTGFTPEVTPRKSRVEGGWDLASPYVVCPCLHTQWSCISGLVGGGDKDLS